MSRVGNGRSEYDIVALGEVGTARGGQRESLLPLTAAKERGEGPLQMTPFTSRQRRRPEGIFSNEIGAPSRRVSSRKLGINFETSLQESGSISFID